MYKCTRMCKALFFEVLITKHENLIILLHNRRNQKQYGVLICPQTQTLDELSFKLISIDSNTEVIFILDYYYVTQPVCKIENE